MKKVRKAVIPAAGLGTRVLPATKVMPKEMLPIVDKPAIQYIVEEAAAAGIEDILIITNRGKGLLEDHFDRAPELERRLAGDPAKEAILDQVVSISKLANIFYVRQKETKGLGHAIGCAREFVGDEPFAVLYGDDVILGKDPACGQLIRAWEEFGLGVVGGKRSLPRGHSQVLLPESGTYPGQLFPLHRYGGEAPAGAGILPFTPFWGGACCPRRSLTFWTGLLPGREARSS